MVCKINGCTNVPCQRARNNRCTLTRKLTTIRLYTFDAEGLTVPENLCYLLKYGICVKSVLYKRINRSRKRDAGVWYGSLQALSRQAHLTLNQPWEPAVPFGKRSTCQGADVHCPCEWGTTATLIISSIIRIALYNNKRPLTTTLFFSTHSLEVWFSKSGSQYGPTKFSEKYEFDSTGSVGRRDEIGVTHRRKMRQISRSFDRSLSLFSLSLSSLQNRRIPPIFFLLLEQPPVESKTIGPRGRMSSNAPVWHTFVMQITQTDLFPCL